MPQKSVDETKLFCPNSKTFWSLIALCTPKIRMILLFVLSVSFYNFLTSQIDVILMSVDITWTSFFIGEYLWYQSVRCIATPGGVNALIAKTSPKFIILYNTNTWLLLFGHKWPSPPLSKPFCDFHRSSVHTFSILSNRSYLITSA